MRLAWRGALAALAIACGPIAGDGDGAAEGSGSTTSSTTAATSISTTTSTDSTSTTTGTTGTSSASTFTSGSTSTDDDTSASDDNSFVIPSDFLCACACDTYSQDCSDGEKCVSIPPGNACCSALCVPLDPNPAQVGEPCTPGPNFTDDCDTAMACFGVDEGTGTGTCVAYCQGTAADPMCEDACMGCWRDDIVDLCLPACDPRVQDCEPGFGCYLGEDTFGCVPNESGMGGAPWTPCEDETDCDPGNVCGSADGVPACDGVFGCCLPVCDTNDPSGCAGAPDGFACAPIQLGDAVAACIPAGVGACAFAG